MRTRQTSIEAPTCAAWLRRAAMALLTSGAPLLALAQGNCDGLAGAAVGAAQIGLPTRGASITQARLV